MSDTALPHQSSRGIDSWQPSVPSDDLASLVIGAPSQGISVGEILRIAADTLLANKLRTILTALGVIIGVAAVVALLAIGKGAQAQITERITANGVNLLTISPGSVSAGGFSSSGGKSQSLTVDDAAALADPANVPDAALVVPEYSGFGAITTGAQETAGMISGVVPAYQQIRNEKLASGEFINEGHIDSAASVAVLGARLAETLFPDGDPLGKYVRLDGQRFRVIGVLEAKGSSPFGSLDNGVAVPLTTAQRKLFNARTDSGKATVSSILVQARDEQSIDAVAAQISATLRERHRLPQTGEGDDFTVDNQKDLINTLTATQRTMTLYLGAIAAISLIVGGIGIMNIMLVSVRERTREIGLRKAIGARERDILRQFLIEALMLSTSGGLIGLMIGAAVALVADASGQSRAILTPDSMLMAVGFAMAVGLVFGIEPARRAARLDPISALRSE